jgi:hypothetical protein
VLLLLMSVVQVITAVLTFGVVFATALITGADGGAVAFRLMYIARTFFTLLVPLAS